MLFESFKLWQVKPSHAINKESLCNKCLGIIIENIKSNFSHQRSAWLGRSEVIWGITCTYFQRSSQKFFCRYLERFWSCKIYIYGPEGQNSFGEKLAHIIKEIVDQVNFIESTACNKESFKMFPLKVLAILLNTAVLEWNLIDPKLLEKELCRYL